VENQGQIKSGEFSQGDEFPLTWRRGEGPRVVIEYLFPDLPCDSSATDEMIAVLHEEEENAVARMVHFFLQARYEESSAEAERCMRSRHPEIRDFALLIHTIIHVAQHNVEVALHDLQILQQQIQHSANRRVAAQNDIYRYVLPVFFHLGEDIVPLPQEILPYCSEGTRLFLLYARSYALYLQQAYEHALGVAEAALMMADMCHPLISIYLNLAASMAAMNLSRFQLADRFFLNALELAIPEGYIQPFIGHHGPLQGMVEKHIRDREPKLYKMIAEKVVHFRTGWTEIHNPRSSHKVTTLLTPYEFALAMMASKGKTNKEIADYLHISINTVKSHLSTIYRILDVTKRTELKERLNL
jgi:DNA-binding CsgD family transcriptional regulator